MSIEATGNKALETKSEGNVGLRLIAYVGTLFVLIGTIIRGSVYAGIVREFI